MKPILFLLFILPHVLLAQKIRKYTEPVTGQSWWVTDKAHIESPGPGSLTAFYRVSPEEILISLDIQKAMVVSSGDMAVFLTTNDTIIARSTGVQAHLEGLYSRDEFRVSREDLKKLSESPLLKVSITHTDGVVLIRVPEKRQRVLIQWTQALLKEMADH